MREGDVEAPSYVASEKSLCGSVNEQQAMVCTSSNVTLVLNALERMDHDDDEG